jgi:hypothetical protein
MSRSKHKRKQQRAQEKAQKKATKVALMDSEKITPENQKESAADSTKETTRNQNPSRWTRFKDWIRKDKTFTDWCIAAFTFVLACAAIYQFVIMGGQLDVMRKDQRPWIKVTFDINTLTAQSPITGTAHIVNGGKTPARDIRGEIVIQRVKNGEQPTFDYPSPNTKFTTGTLFPNESPANVTIKRTRFINKGPSVEDDILTKDEFDDLQKTKIFFIVYATISYKDFFETKHWTKQCAFFTPANISGDFYAQKCTNYGDIDDN